MALTQTELNAFVGTHFDAVSRSPAQKPLADINTGLLFKIGGY